MEGVVEVQTVCKHLHAQNSMLLFICTMLLKVSCDWHNIIKDIFHIACVLRHSCRTDKSANYSEQSWYNMNHYFHISCARSNTSSKQRPACVLTLPAHCIGLYIRWAPCQSNTIVKFVSANRHMRTFNLLRLYQSLDLLDLFKENEHNYHICFNSVTTRSVHCHTKDHNPCSIACLS